MLEQKYLTYLNELTEKVIKYVSANYKEPPASYEFSGRASLAGSYNPDWISYAMRDFSPSDPPARTLKTLEKSTDPGFVDVLTELIRVRQLRDTDVYKAAGIDRRLFSKIVSNSDYKPSKDTCIALCLALKLTLKEANDLLQRAGYALSHSIRRDVILEYFFREQVYSVSDINMILTRLEEKPLGR